MDVSSFWSFMEKLIAPGAAILGIYLSHKFSLKSSYRNKIWELRVEIYSKISSKINEIYHGISIINSSSIDEYQKMTVYETTHEKIDEMGNIFTEYYLMLSPDMIDIIGRFFREMEETYNFFDYEKYKIQLKIIDNYRKKIYDRGNLEIHGSNRSILRNIINNIRSLISGPAVPGE